MFHIVLQSFHTASISESQPLVLRFRMNEWSDKELRRENIRQTSLILVSKIDHDSELMFSDLVPIQFGCFMMMMLGLEAGMLSLGINYLFCHPLLILLSLSSLPFNTL